MTVVGDGTLDAPAFRPNAFDDKHIRQRPDGRRVVEGADPYKSRDADCLRYEALCSI